MDNEMCGCTTCGSGTYKNTNLDWQQIGIIGVDAGICWIGDPCYILHKETPPPEIGKNWSDFCEKLGDEYPTTKQFEYALGHPGLGVCVSTGYGDGEYPVFVKKNAEGRIVEVKVVFSEE